MIIERKIREDIRRIITEELHISDDVKYMSRDISAKIAASMRNTSPEQISRGVSRKYGRVETKLGKGKIKVSYEVYQFGDKETMDTFIIEKGGGNQFSVRVNNNLSLMNVFLCCTGGQMSKQDVSELSDTIYHETSHLYQQEKMGDRYKFNNDYRTALALIGSPNTVKHKVALVLYLSNKSEQVAFANGLYGFLKQMFFDENADIDPKCYKQSAMYKILKECMEVRQFLLGNKSIVCQELRESGYSISYQRLLKMCEETINELERKIGRILVKFFSDKHENGEISVTDTNDFYDVFI